jgi:hypothetical protein
MVHQRQCLPPGLEGSTNLLNWTWLGVRSNASGMVQYTDARATNPQAGSIASRYPSRCGGGGARKQTFSNADESRNPRKSTCRWSRSGNTLCDIHFGFFGIGTQKDPKIEE